MAWYKTFFRGVALDFWRAAMTPEFTASEADFLEKHLQAARGERLLDVPCGNGRLSLELASRGYQLTGVDFATEFMEEARTQSIERHLNIDWQERDMRDLPWSKEFDGAFCLGNSFGYLEDGENEIFINAVSRTLKPGARFIIDTHAAAECTLPGLEEHRSFEIGDITLAVDNRYDHETSRLFTDYNFIREGKGDLRPGSQRIYSYRELSQLLNNADLPITTAFGSRAEEPYKLGSPTLILICEKR